MIFAGLTNAAVNARHYIECIESVRKVYNKKYKQLPLVVNTMGWNRGLGVSLLLKIVGMFRPTMVVQLNSERSRDNFPDITPDFFNNSTDFYSFEHSTAVNGLVSNIPSQVNLSKINWSHHVLKIPFDCTLSYSDKITPADVRSLSLFSYFSTNNKKDPSDDLDPVLGMPVYAMSYEELALHVCHADVPRRLILESFNGSLCSLCTVDDRSIVEGDFEESPKFLKETPVCRSLGLGIVQSVSAKHRTLCIATNVPLSVLGEVNCLLKGAVELPKLLYDCNNDACAIGLPYLDFTLNALGVAPAKAKGQCVARKRSNN